MRVVRCTIKGEDSAEALAVVLIDAFRRHLEPRAPSIDDYARLAQACRKTVSAVAQLMSEEHARMIREPGWPPAL